MNAKNAMTPLGDEIDRLRTENERLVKILAGMLAIHDSVTQGQERELKEEFIPLARAVLKQKEVTP